MQAKVTAKVYLTPATLEHTGNAEGRSFLSFRISEVEEIRQDFIVIH